MVGGGVETEKLIMKCAAVLKRMRSAAYLRKNDSEDMKNRLMEL